MSARLSTSSINSALNACGSLSPTSPLPQTAAETIVNNLSQDEIKVLELTGEDRMAHVRAKQFLAATSVPLVMAAMYFARMAKLLGGEGPFNPDKLIEVAD